MEDHNYEILSGRYFEDGFLKNFSIFPFRRSSATAQDFRIEIQNSSKFLEFWTVSLSDVLISMLSTRKPIPIPPDDIPRRIFKLRDQLFPLKDDNYLVGLRSKDIHLFQYPVLKTREIESALASIIWNADYESGGENIRIRFLDYTVDCNIRELKRRLNYFNNCGWITGGDGSGGFIELTEKGRGEMKDESKEIPTNKTPIIVIKDSHISQPQFMVNSPGAKQEIHISIDNSTVNTFLTELKSNVATVSSDETIRQELVDRISRLESELQSVTIDQSKVKILWFSIRSILGKIGTSVATQYLTRMLGLEN